MLILEDTPVAQRRSSFYVIMDRFFYLFLLAGTVACAALFVASYQDPDLNEKLQPQNPELFSGFAITIFYLLFGAAALYALKVSKPHMTLGDVRRVTYGFLFLIGLLFVDVIALDKLREHLLFADCPTPPQLIHYFWFVADALAKGMLIYLMDTFDIHLTACAVRKPDFINSATVFVIRSFSSAFVIWLALSWWKTRHTTSTPSF